MILVTEQARRMRLLASSFHELVMPTLGTPVAGYLIA